MEIKEYRILKAWTLLLYGIGVGQGQALDYFMGWVEEETHIPIGLRMVARRRMNNKLIILIMTTLNIVPTLNY